MSLTDTATTVYALGPAAAYARLQAVTRGGHGYGYGHTGDVEGGRRVGIDDPGPPPPPPLALYDTSGSGGLEESVSEVVDVDALFRSAGGR